MYLLRFCYRHIVLIILLILSLGAFAISAPLKFPAQIIFNVPSGSGLSQVAVDLKSAGLIRSEFVFKIISIALGGPRGLKAGDYLIQERLNTFSLARRLSVGDTQLQPVRITIREGLNIYETANIIHDNFPHIRPAEFLAIASSSEGYLFPDTYLFFPNVSAEQIIQELRQNFDNKIAGLQSDIKASGKKLDDIIKMASILELEANTEESQGIVSGILWNRIKIGMPLQVDASFKYINGKTTANLTLDDLKINSEYNGYVYRGLPPTPISNPGLTAIQAALFPTKSNYLYFLTDRDGKMRYSVTYEQHLQNKALYLK